MKIKEYLTKETHSKVWKELLYTIILLAIALIASHFTYDEGYWDGYDQAAEDDKVLQESVDKLLANRSEDPLVNTADHIINLALYKYEIQGDNELYKKLAEYFSELANEWENNKPIEEN